MHDFTLVQTYSNGNRLLPEYCLNIQSAMNRVVSAPENAKSPVAIVLNELALMFPDLLFEQIPCKVLISYSFALTFLHDCRIIDDVYKHHRGKQTSMFEFGFHNLGIYSFVFMLHPLDMAV